MKYLINLKIQATWIVLGAFILLIAGLHASTVAHVEKHGVAVSAQAMAAIVNPEVVLTTLNTHQPVTVRNLPSEALLKTEIDPRLSVMLRSDGKLHLTGLSYLELRKQGIQLPIFIIQ